MVGLELALKIAGRLRSAEPRALRHNRIDTRGIVFGCGHVPSLAIGQSTELNSSRPDPSRSRDVRFGASPKSKIGQLMSVPQLIPDVATRRQRRRKPRDCTRNVPAA